MNWAKEELATIDLGDERLDKRAVLLLERLAQKPGASIPNACASWAETAGAYRFLRNEQVNAQEVLTSHADATRVRMAQHAVVLCLQDTTVLDFNGQAMTGLGPLSFEAQRGLYVHPTYVVTPQREPLGIINSWNWAREFKDAQGQRAGMLESTRWVESYERIAESAAEMPGTRCVCVGDRESDIMALMLRARTLNHPADYLLRSQHNRNLPGELKLWSSVQADTPLGRISFTIPSGRGRKARKVSQEIRAKRVELPDGKGATVEVTCLIASEVDAPLGAKPIVWRLADQPRSDDA